MDKKIVLVEVLFEIKDIFGNNVRITKVYWQKIKNEKHKELKFGHKKVIEALIDPDEVYRSVQDEFIRLFFKKIGNDTLVVLVKYLNGDGFVVTVYQTTKVKRKGEKLWPK